MPIVEAHILEGYSDREKTRLISALTDAIRFVVPAPDAAITVMLHEHASANYARGGVARTPAPALPDPAETVRAFLAAMEARDLPAAEAMLGPGFTMTFPGTAPMTRLAELIDWAKDRYRFVTKTFEAVEAFSADGAGVVYTRGTLAGEWPDGTTFEGIRFVDRFELRDGLIVRQDVWNDIAEMRPA
jgi:4-oxalocrotonate tautomerase family enzyme